MFTLSWIYAIQRMKVLWRWVYHYEKCSTDLCRTRFKTDQDFHFIFDYGRSSRLISVTWNIISTVTEGALSICEHHCCAFVLATFLNGAGVVQLLTSHYKTVSYLRTQFVRCDLKLQRCTALATHKRRHQRYWPRFLQRILPSQVWSAAGTDTFASRRTRVRLAFGIP